MASKKPLAPVKTTILSQIRQSLKSTLKTKNKRPFVVRNSLYPILSMSLDADMAALEL